MPTSDYENLALQRGLAVWQVRKLTSYIESNMSGRIRAAELAAQVYISQGRLFKAFRTSFGMSPHTYIMRQRIRRAEVLMASSDRPLSHIAMDCGLYDQAHFSRAFRRIVGVTPKMWRRSAATRFACAVSPPQFRPDPPRAARLTPGGPTSPEQPD